MTEPTDEQIITALSPMGIIHKVDIELYRAGWRAALAAAPPSAPALDRLIPEQVRCPICQTFLDDANEAHDCVVAAAPAPADDLPEWVLAGDGTLHGAIDYWQALSRERAATIAALTEERDGARKAMRAKNDYALQVDDECAKLRVVVEAADAMREAVICGFGVKVARDLYDDARAAVKGE